MIKVSKFIYIHWLTVLLGIFCYITRQLEVFFVSFIIMTIHECAHLFAAKRMGLTPGYIVIYPFGVNLRLENTMLYSITDEIILYISGPLSNVIMALFCLPFMKNNAFLYDFYLKNIALFVLNMLPIAPLDGGMIFKKLIMYKFGFDLGDKITKFVSLTFAVIPVVLSVYMIYINSFNASACFFSAFALGNVVCSREKYNSTLVKELVYCRKKRTSNTPYNAKLIGADKKTKYIDIAKKFNMSSSYFVVFTDNNRISDIKTEEEIINSLLVEDRQKYDEKLNR